MSGPGVRVARHCAVAAIVPALIGMAGTPPASGQQHAGHMMATDSMGAVWRMPPQPIPMPMMLPGLMGAVPGVTPYLPDPGHDPAMLPEAVFREVVEMADGDTLRLEAGFVRRTIGTRTFTMYGFNGQYPGPLIRVPQGAEIVVLFTNNIDLPTAVHWHGVRLENEFDGVPGVTQDPVEPGESFMYRVHFRDAGLYWYHPHHREDIQQDLGLYGNMLVDAPAPDYYGPANGEDFLMLDDLLVDEGGLFPWGREAAVQTLMGRFGNQLLVNGEPRWEATVRRGEVRRLYLTNVANTRTFNLVLEGAEMKLVGADVSKFERESFVSNVILAPAQRYIVDARFDEPGTWALLNPIQAIDHFNGRFYPQTDTLGIVTVLDEPVAQDHGDAFSTLREHADVIEDIGRYRAEFGRPVDHELELTVRVGDLPSDIVAVMAIDTLYFPPVEWTDAMPMMNFLSTSENLTWILRDTRTGKENRDIDWRFTVGDVRKLRIHNQRRSFHPMQHPIHIHGQRFLVLSKDGVPADNLAWKDTVVIPVGSTFDILLEASNSGRWMAHCHIAEHLEAGMSMVFTVDPG
ncbi:multicopper oxidase family protein [Candidatus Palauibacter sp.]|uniref:multicopper oxidase family protein n=1 Tax=Candidatus Palauibacter sp. TaxID=3101350 RepID=UPI003B01BE99